MKQPITHHPSPFTPVHVAVIMDGNRRWAKERGLPALEGHRRVANDILEPLIEHAVNRGVQYMTFWAWSTENWQRNKSEVEGIMRLFRDVIGRQWQRLHEKGVRIRVIGDIGKFSEDIRKALEKIVAQTDDNKKITVIFALNYGGRDEILRAIETWRANSKFQIPNSKLTQKEFSYYLDSKGIPDPDLIVRTGGEQRLSGFLSWQSVYSELYFPDWHMPEFTPEKLDEVLAEYASRQRRFGR